MKHYIVILAAVALVVASFFLGRRSCRSPEGQIIEIHDTTTVIKTVRDTVRKIVTRTIARIDTVYLATADTSSPGDSVDNTLKDSVNVELPIERVTVKGDHYTAVIEGFRPSLVDMQIDIPTQYVTTTKTENVRRRWSLAVGPQIGAGYGIGGFTPYVGVGFTFGYCF